MESVRTKYHQLQKHKIKLNKFGVLEKTKLFNYLILFNLNHKKFTLKLNVK